MKGRRKIDLFYAFIHIHSNRHIHIRFFYPHLSHLCNYSSWVQQSLENLRPILRPDSGISVALPNFSWRLFLCSFDEEEMERAHAAKFQGPFLLGEKRHYSSLCQGELWWLLTLFGPTVFGLLHKNLRRPIPETSFLLPTRWRGCPYVIKSTTYSVLSALLGHRTKFFLI